MPIRRLPQEITNRIAAGEVVERPASVIKELLENSLDAGAKNITIEMEDGGCRSLKISDDGSGIVASELPLAVARYATSKIARLEDIYNISSYGFRGEALSSVAAVARVEITSRVAAAVSGARLVVANGRVEEQEPCGSPKGTTIKVSDIFAEIPARRKFLRAAASELASALEAITHTALAAPDVRINVSNNGREIAFFPACGDITARATAVLGRGFTEGVLPVAIDTGEVVITGIFSPPARTSANSKNILIYVNNRFVKDYLISHAVQGAYRRLIEPKRYPFALLFLSVEPGDVDVNVHPAKREVRWRFPRVIYDTVSLALAQTLTAAAPGTEATVATDGATEEEAYKKRVEEALHRYAASYEKKPDEDFFARDDRRRYGALSNALPVQGTRRTEMGENEVPSHHREPAASGTTTPSVPDVATNAPAASRTSAETDGEWRYLGAIRNTYLLFEDAAGLVIVDQHAAHERIVFEELKRTSTAAGVKVQELLVPEVLTLPLGEANTLRSLLPLFAEVGFLLEEFGADTYIVKGMPGILAAVSPERLIGEVLATASAAGGKPNLDDWRERILTSCACSQAVKARMGLTPREVVSLIKRLQALGSRLTCPHGRPVLVRIGLDTVEKMFKRR